MRPSTTPRACTTAEPADGSAGSGGQQRGFVTATDAYGTDRATHACTTDSHARVHHSYALAPPLQPHARPAATATHACRTPSHIPAHDYGHARVRHVRSHARVQRSPALTPRALPRSPSNGDNPAYADCI